MLHGETGTGKGLIARTIHRVGPRGSGPFVDINCAAIPEHLLEAELFGYERGAFIDARRSKPGLLRLAHRGTLFLDEIDLLPASLQPKLLKFLDDGAVRRLGGTSAEMVDVWIVSATNADLAAAVRERRFREDLYHRLAVVTIPLPPLRERGHDAILLANRFLSRACADYRLPALVLARDARARLLAHRWPGNIRELSNTIERAALLAETEAAFHGCSRPSSFYLKRVSPTEEYTFKHALTHDVIYESLPAPRRQALHGLVGRKIEDLYPDQLEEQAVVLAYHYSRSDYRDDAIKYAVLAGDRAPRVYANAEAAIYYDQALALNRALTASPERQRVEIDASIKRAGVSTTREAQAQDGDNLERARMLALALEDEPRLARALYWLGRLAYVRGAFRVATDYAEQSLDIADRLGDEALAAPR